MKKRSNIKCRNYNLTRDNKVHKPYLAKFDKTVIKEENMSKKHKHISATKTTEQKAVQQSQQPQELTPQKLNRLLEKIHLHSFWEWNCWKCGKAMLTEECAWMSILRIFTVECMADVRMRLLIRLLVWRHPPMAIMLQRLTGNELSGGCERYRLRVR